MSQSSDTSDTVEPDPPSDAASAIHSVKEVSEQQSMTNSSDRDSEEVEHQMMANPHEDSNLDDLLLSSRLSAITNAESLKETILEQQTIVTEFGPADPHSCAEIADCDQQDVRVFTPRNFSFQELLDSNAAERLNSDGSELGAPSDAAANEVETRIPDHDDNNDWKEWLIDQSRG